MRPFFLIAFVLLLIPLASAQCFDFQISKSEYLSGETLQAEITGTFLKPLTVENFFFYQNEKEYFPVFTLSQLSSNKWILFFDVPKNYGENVMEIKNILCKDGILKEESKRTTFIIRKPVDDLYSEVFSSVKGKLPSFDSEISSLALLAFSYDDSIVIEAKNSLLSKSSGGKCWPPESCSIKDTSLALLALKEINDDIRASAPKDWLLDAENNVKMGLWDLIIQSPSQQQCNLTMNSVSRQISLNSGGNSASLSDIPDDSEINLSLSCSLQSAEISHTYMGNVKKYPMSLSNGSFISVLDNGKCWGIGYRESCDPSSTAYALWALQGSEMQKEKAWLEEHAVSTEEKALSDSLGSSKFENYLDNNQAPEGYWSNSSLALSDLPDVSSTVAALRVLSGPQRQKGEEWLISKISSMTLREKLLSLQLFPSADIEPILSFSQGFFKSPSESKITLSLTNKGIMSMNVDVSLGGKISSAVISAKERKDIVLEVPSADSIIFASIMVSYRNNLSESSKSYKIPMMIYPKAYTPKQVSDILQTPTETSLIGGDISFVEKSINQTLPLDIKSEIVLNLKNSGTISRNMTMVVLGLYGIVESVEPSDFTISPGETRSVKLTIDSSKGFGDYEGSVNAETLGSSISIPIQISISKEAKASDNKTFVTPSNGTGAVSQKKSNLKWIGWLMVFLALAVAGGYFYLKLRKKKGESPIMEQLKKIKTEPMNQLNE